MKRQEIRLRRVHELVAVEGGLARFAERVGMSNSQVSQFAGKNPTRNIGNGVAAKIEAAYGKPAGWLDAAEDDVLQPEESQQDQGGDLRALQIREAKRILDQLDDAALSTALGALQELFKRASHAAGETPAGGQPKGVPEISFTVGRRSPGTKRQGVK